MLCYSEISQPYRASLDSILIFKEQIPNVHLLPKTTSNVLGASKADWLLGYPKDKVKLIESLTLDILRVWDSSRVGTVEAVELGF